VAEPTFYPAGQVVEDTMTSNPPFLLIGSDASIHAERSLATCAWMISHTDTEFIKACAHITNISSITSYRGSLKEYTVPFGMYYIATYARNK